MAQAAVRTKVEVFVAGPSAALTLAEPAIAIRQAAIMNGSTTITGAVTATVTTATSSVVNSLTFTGTAEAPSRTVTTNSSLGAGSLVVVEYIPAGQVQSDH